MNPFWNEVVERSERARSATANAARDAVATNKSHPSQSPFLRKGEEESVIASNDEDQSP